MQAQDAARAGSGEDIFGDALGRPLPVIADDGPKHAQQVQAALRASNAEPAKAVRRAKENRDRACFGAEDLLGLG